jgi:hypothetical protein
VSLLPIPVGLSKPATCHSWSIVRFMLHDTPLPYTVDPDLDYTLFVRSTGQLNVSFPNLGTVIIDSDATTVVVPALAIDAPGPDAEILFQADHGQYGRTTKTAFRLLSVALYTAVVKYTEQAPSNVRDVIETFLYGGPSEQLLRNLLHFRPTKP